MLRSARPQKPHARSKRKPRPPWTDPETRVVPRHGAIVTIIIGGEHVVRFWIPAEDAHAIRRAAIYREHRARKAGA
jgi:hypothetical protein